MGFWDTVKDIGKSVSSFVPVVGPLIGAGLDLIGSEKTNKQQKALAADNVAMQKEFAQYGIRWKADDARAAGLHPLAALGSNTVSFNPVHVGRSEPNWAGHGQNLGRAMAAIQSKEERALNKIKIAQEMEILKKLGLENAGLSKLLKDSKSTPPFPGATQDKSGIWSGDLDDDYDTLIATMKQKGVMPEANLTFNEMTGTIKYYPSQDIMDLISESMIAAASYYADLGTYKSVIMHGKANPYTKNGRFYANEKQRVERIIGAPVYLTDAGRWRLKNWRNR